MSERILLDQGSGGRASQRLIGELFVKHFANPELERLNDAARLELSGPLPRGLDKIRHHVQGNVVSIQFHLDRARIPA